LEGARVATTDPTGDFVIDLEAHALMRTLSSEYANTILGIAARNADVHTDDGRPFIGVCDIAEASAALCAALEAALNSGELTEKQTPIIEHLQEFCKRAFDACENDGGTCG